MGDADDGFIGAKLLRDEKDEKPFDASHYAFFGGLQGGDDDDLLGGLEDDVDAPPEESFPDDAGIEYEDEALPDLGEADDQDLSITSMLLRRKQAEELGQMGAAATPNVPATATSLVEPPSLFGTTPGGSTWNSALGLDFQPQQDNLPRPVAPAAAPTALAGVVPGTLGEGGTQGVPALSAEYVQMLFTTATQYVPMPQQLPLGTEATLAAWAGPQVNVGAPAAPPADDPTLAMLLNDPAIASVQREAPSNQAAPAGEQTLANLFNSALNINPVPKPVPMPMGPPPAPLGLPGAPRPSPVYPGVPPVVPGPPGPLLGALQGPVPPDGVHTGVIARPWGPPPAGPPGAPPRVPSPVPPPPYASRPPGPAGARPNAWFPAAPPQPPPYPPGAEPSKPRPPDGPRPPYPPPGPAPPAQPGAAGSWAKGPPGGLIPAHLRPRPPPGPMPRPVPMAPNWEPHPHPYPHHQQPHQHLHHSLAHGSKHMSAEELDHILRIQWRSLHQTDSTYLEDYYYQAFVYKYLEHRNAKVFKPPSIRNLAPSEKAAPGSVNFVQLAGLGKLALSNIRRPRPIMDIDATEVRRRDAEGGGAQGISTKPLEQEPLLAARIMIEDCMCLLLDVDDVDRLLDGHGTGGLSTDALLQRRAELLDGLTDSMHLPQQPTFPSSEGVPNKKDGVFLRLLALKKGCTLLATALRVVALPSRHGPEEPVPTALGAPNLAIVWATLRNARFLFSAVPKHVSERTAVDAQGSMTAEEIQVTAQIAQALTTCVSRLESAEHISSCVEALVHGDLANCPTDMDALLPLLAPGQSSPADASITWLGNVLVALLDQASTMGLQGPFTGSQGTTTAAEQWPELWTKLFELVLGHVGFLNRVMEAAVEGTPEQQAMSDAIRSLVPSNVLRATFPHCTPDQRHKLREQLQLLA